MKYGDEEYGSWEKELGRISWEYTELLGILQHGTEEDVKECVSIPSIPRTKGHHLEIFPLLFTQRTSRKAGFPYTPPTHSHE
jgi:hypothetical protein